MTAIWCLPAVALATYIFAFPHYKFRSQLIFFVLIVLFTLQLIFVVTVEGRVCACIGLGLVSAINILRFTAPQL
jgi:hypothetical protein